MTLQILHEVLALYLVLTLSATGVSKARNWRQASNTVSSERLIPHQLAGISIAVVTIAEILLAAFVATRFMPRAVGIVIAAMFLVFGVYKLVAGLKRGVLGCACAGSQMVYKATVPGVIATCLASLTQAGAAAVYAFTPPVRESMLLDMLLVSAFALPIAMFLYRFLAPATKRHEGRSNYVHTA